MVIGYHVFVFLFIVVLISVVCSIFSVFRIVVVFFFLVLHAVIGGV